MEDQFKDPSMLPIVMLKMQHVDVVDADVDDVEDVVESDTTLDQETPRKVVLHVEVVVVEAVVVAVDVVVAVPTVVERRLLVTQMAVNAEDVVVAVVEAVDAVDAVAEAVEDKADRARPK